MSDLTGQYFAVRDTQGCVSCLAYRGGDSTGHRDLMRFDPTLLDGRLVEAFLKRRGWRPLTLAPPPFLLLEARQQLRQLVAIAKADKVTAAGEKAITDAQVVITAALRPSPSAMDCGFPTDAPPMDADDDDA